ncbi:MAG: hypothetical protein AAFQ89_22325 [Cyanobacteria bacterium J06626_18]
MKKSVIETFLNLPGMLGLALLDRHSCSYVYGTDRLQRLQQSETTVQGIQQIVSTTPADLKAFDFWFAHANVRIYKLDNDLILLVLTDKALDIQRYQTALVAMQEALQTDTENTLSLLRTLADHRVSSPQVAQPTKPFRPAPGWRPPSPPKPLPEKIPTIASVPSLTAVPPLPSILRTTYDWKTGITALNALTDATAKYLGPTVTTNAWRLTRPEVPMLEKLHCDREGHFSYLADAADGSDSIISFEEHEHLEQWVQAFVKRCSLIIRDYPETVLQQSLEDSQRALLRI